MIWLFLYSFTEFSAFTFARFVSLWGWNDAAVKLISKVLDGGTPGQRSYNSDMCFNWTRATGPQGPRLMEKAEGAREGTKMELLEPVLLRETSPLSWLKILACQLATSRWGFHWPGSLVVGKQFSWCLGMRSLELGCLDWGSNLTLNIYMTFASNFNKCLSFLICEMGINNSKVMGMEYEEWRMAQEGHLHNFRTYFCY